MQKVECAGNVIAGRGRNACLLLEIPSRVLIEFNPAVLLDALLMSTYMCACCFDDELAVEDAYLA